MLNFDNRGYHDSMNKYRGHNFINAKNWFNEIEPFTFSYTRPCLDWYETQKVEIRWNDFDEFRLELRFGPSVWLVGIVLYSDRNEIEEYQIGEFEHKEDLERFIEWNKKLCKNGGTAIKKITCLHNGLFDYFDLKEWK